MNNITLPRIPSLDQFRQGVGDILESFQSRVQLLQPEDHVLPVNRFGVVFGGDSLMGLAKDLARPDGNGMDMAMAEHAIKQLAARSRVPVDFLKRMPPQMRTVVLNHFIKEFAANSSSTERMMLFRTINDPGIAQVMPGLRTVRAMLTESYTPFDDITLFQHAAEVIGDEKCIAQFSKTETLNTHVRLIFPNDLTEITRGTEVARTIHIRNSEVGNGAASIEGGLLVLKCTNGMMGHETTGKYSIRHVGRAERVRDYVRQAIEDSYGVSRRLINQFQQSLEIKVEDPRLSLAAIQHSEGLSRESFDAMLAAYSEEPVESLFGIAQAVTRAAQAQPTAEDRYQMEKVATKLLDAPKVALNPLDFIPKKEYAALGIER